MAELGDTNLPAGSGAGFAERDRLGRDDGEVSPWYEAAARDLEVDPGELSQVAEESSQFIADWRELVSRTNWEKGRIVCQWREKVCSVHPEVKPVSDRAWSELIGGLSPEHVGRLRRTYERFGEIYSNFGKLSWSHFMVATSWDDAEMWLEGAVQNGWTVDQMRRTRWEALGAVEEQRPQPEEVTAEETVDELDRPIAQSDGDVISGPILEGPDWGDADAPSPKSGGAISAAEIEALLESAPFEVSQAFEAMSGAIDELHKEDWVTFKRRDLLKVLSYLRQRVRRG